MMNQHIEFDDYHFSSTFMVRLPLEQKPEDLDDEKCLVYLISLRSDENYFVIALVIAAAAFNHPWLFIFPDLDLDNKDGF